MAQVTIYLPKDLEARLRRKARRARKSMSSYIADLARHAVSRGRGRGELDRLYGSWKGEFPPIEDRPPVDVPEL